MNLFNNARHQGHVLLKGVALLLLFCVIGTANAFLNRKPSQARFPMQLDCRSSAQAS